MRATQHNGRQHRNGQVFNPKHNDRDFNVENAKHIDSKKVDDNFYWSWNGQSFDEAERCFYEEKFGASLQQQNERYKRHGDYKKIKTIDDFRSSARYCPEEQIIQLGHYDRQMSQVVTVSPDTLKKILYEQIIWETERYPNAVILDYAIHNDETTPHAHIRKVWVADDKGKAIVSQKKALEQMGVKPPKTEESGRYNNAKMTYTAECRQHLEEVCRSYGIELESKRLEVSRTGLDLLEYQRRGTEEEVDELTKKLDETRKEVAKLRKAIIETEERYAEQINGDSRKQINRLINERDGAEEIAWEYRKRLEEAGLDTSLEPNKNEYSRQQKRKYSRIPGRE